MTDLKNEDFSEKYLDIVKGELASLNLTRILDKEEFHVKQYVDSLLPYMELSNIRDLLEESEMVVDLGCGGGFPLLPMAHHFPENFFVGIDARDKKIAAVNLIAEQMGLYNAKAAHARFEQILFDIPCFITSKAVGKIKPILECLNLEAESYFLFYKGPGVYEQEKIPSNCKGWKLIDEQKLSLASEYQRTYFLYHFVPRGTVKKKKNLVNLTHLI
jgi:16S rRNA (guanine527-N7)-methyltransferase